MSYFNSHYRSVTVDLAAEAGGNVETTEPGKVIRTKNGVTCIGYTDLPGRCAAQSSTLFGNNVANFILSMGDAKEGRYVYFNSHHMGNWYDGVFCVQVRDQARRRSRQGRFGDARLSNHVPPARAQAQADKTFICEQHHLFRIKGGQF